MKKYFWEAIQAKLNGEKTEKLSVKQLVECVNSTWKGKTSTNEAIDMIKEISSLIETDVYAKKFIKAINEAAKKIGNIMISEAYKVEDDDITIIASSEKKDDDEKEEIEEKKEDETEDEEKKEEVDEDNDAGYLKRLKEIAMKRKDMKETKDETVEEKKEDETEDEEKKEKVDESTPLQRFKERLIQQKKLRLGEEKEEEKTEEVDEKCEKEEKIEEKKEDDEEDEDKEDEVKESKQYKKAKMIEEAIISRASRMVM